MCDSTKDSDLPGFPVEIVVADAAANQRLDAFVTKQLSQFSRAAVQRAIAAGLVLVDGESAKPSLRLEVGATVRIAEIETVRPGPEPQEIPLDILYEDDWLAVVNKPAGMIVHPAKGHWNGTLASALAFRFEQLSTTGGPQRPGIVHRLDRDTSGVIVVARHDRAHEALATQFKDRTTEKEYWAIVRGVPDRDADVIDRPIGPHPKIREAKAVRPDHPDARPAVTKYEVVERFERFSLLRVLPKTGRTHQIRVHLASVGFPILCDKMYGGSSEVAPYQLLPGAASLKRRSTGDLAGHAPVLHRQALHAQRLTINHPQSGERVTFEAPLPSDLKATISCLRNLDNGV